MPHIAAAVRAVRSDTRALTRLCSRTRILDGPAQSTSGAHAPQLQTPAESATARARQPMWTLS